MDYTPPRDGLPTKSATSTGPDTRARLHLRAHELAVTAGNVEPLVTQAHFEQAEREVIGRPPQRRSPARRTSELEVVQS